MFKRKREREKMEKEIEKETHAIFIRRKNCQTVDACAFRGLPACICNVEPCFRCANKHISSFNKRKKKCITVQILYTLLTRLCLS
ncbi:hypothetical protein PUN28_003383 [Cardiocondyla obscurior]|uniref:Uncharacterized protein n=1 Tax=Cardiocondyla obscurior TaxID=286306 RepID=A0AAW2GLQ9_9HYME